MSRPMKATRTSERTETVAQLIGSPDPIGARYSEALD